MELKDYDFIEIGSCDFDTITETCTHEFGIVVEPIQEYLDNLEDKVNVIKVNAAIAPDNIEGEAKFYYIPSQTIKEKRLHEWLRGCNSINQPHPQHKQYMEYVKEIIVPQIPLHKLLENNGVRGIKHLKTDIEGRDCELLENFIPYLKSKPKEYWPQRITFETNILTEEHVINRLIKLYNDLGYITLIKEIGGGISSSVLVL